MKKIYVVTCIIGLAAGGFASRAAAQIPQAISLCENKDNASFDVQISGCTTLIQSGAGSNEGRAGVYMLRGNAYDGKRQHHLAIQDYDQAIKLNPNFALAFANRGLAYEGEGQHDRAIQDEDQAIKLDPTLAIAFLNRGVSYNSKGRYDLAMRDYDQAIKLNPNFAQAYYNRGAIYQMSGERADPSDFGRAIQDYDEAIKLYPNFAQAYNNRGLAKRARGDFAGGDADIAKARQLGFVGN